MSVCWIAMKRQCVVAAVEPAFQLLIVLRLSSGRSTAPSSSSWSFSSRRQVEVRRHQKDVPFAVGWPFPSFRLLPIIASVAPDAFVLTTTTWRLHRKSCPWGWMMMMMMMMMMVSSVLCHGMSALAPPHPPCPRPACFQSASPCRHPVLE